MKRVTSRDRAAAWLTFRLADGPVLSQLIRAEARAAGITERTLYRAANTLGVETRRQGYQGRSEWALPSEPDEYEVGPGTGVIYGLAGPDGSVQYVGQTTNLRQRINAHRGSIPQGGERLRRWLTDLRAADEQFTVVKLATAPVGELDKLEQKFIQSLDPPLNVQPGGRNSSVNYRVNKAGGLVLPAVLSAVPPLAPPSTRAEVQPADPSPSGEMAGMAQLVIEPAEGQELSTQPADRCSAHPGQTLNGDGSCSVCKAEAWMAGRRRGGVR